MIKPEWLTNNFETEQQFQAYTFKEILHEFPMFKDKVWHTENEVYIEKRKGESKEDYEKRCSIIGNRSKAQGKLAGVMDILILWKGILYKIELKLPYGVLSPAQVKIHDIWTKDCSKIPPVVCKVFLEVYNYCKLILSNGFKINFTENFNFARWCALNLGETVEFLTDKEIKELYEKSRLLLDNI